MLVSIGFEAETQWMSLVKLYPGHRAFNPLSSPYRIRLSPNVEAYPDVFNRHDIIDSFVEKNEGDVRLGGLYRVPAGKLRSIFSNLEFVVTYPDPVNVGVPEDIFGWTMDCLIRSIGDIRHAMSAENGWHAVPGSSTKDYYYRGEFMINPQKGVGILCRQPNLSVEFASKANFVIQCTYGIPLVCAHTVFRVLQDVYGRAVASTADDLVAASWRWVQSLGGDLDDAQANFLFLFYYSYRTLSRRKVSAVFVIRHPMRNLWQKALTADQRVRIIPLILGSDARSYFETVVLTGSNNPQMQDIADVGLVPYDQKRKRFFFEFRALTRILRMLVHNDPTKKHLTLDSIASL